MEINEKHRSDLSVLRDENAKMQLRIGVVETANAELAAELARVESSLRTAIENHTDANNVIAALRADNAALREERDSAYAGLTGATKEQLAAAQVENAALHADLEKTKTELQLWRDGNIVREEDRAERTPGDPPMTMSASPNPETAGAHRAFAQVTG